MSKGIRSEEKMRIIYVSYCCSTRVYQELVGQIKNMQQQAQKFHQLLITGFTAQDGVQVQAVSALPVNTHNFNRRFVNKSVDYEENATYYHVAAVNLPILKTICNFAQTFTTVSRGCRGQRERCVAICDALKTTSSSAALLACHLHGVKCWGLLTDVPRKRAERGSIFTRIVDYLGWRQLKRYDGYVFLTGQMNELINVKQRPYVIVEGVADIRLIDTTKTIPDSNTPRICMYAGSLKRVYGIAALVDGFTEAAMPNTVLHIYGDGDYRQELEEKCKENPSIRYFGVVPNAEVVVQQQKATLLINPRPSIGEYTKYSFPSKNIEYLASGTPVLATRLPGIPSEYEPYYFPIIEESPDGIRRALKRVLSLSDKELYHYGEMAKAYVLSEKNNVVQARRILEALDAD